MCAMLSPGGHTEELPFHSVFWQPSCTAFCTFDFLLLIFFVLFYYFNYFLLFFMSYVHYIPVKECVLMFVDDNVLHK